MYLDVTYCTVVATFNVFTRKFSHDKVADGTLPGTIPGCLQYGPVMGNSPPRKICVLLEIFFGIHFRHTSLLELSHRHAT